MSANTVNIVLSVGYQELLLESIPIELVGHLLKGKIIEKDWKLNETYISEHRVGISSAPGYPLRHAIVVKAEREALEAAEKAAEQAAKDKAAQEAAAEVPDVWTGISSERVS